MEGKNENLDEHCNVRDGCRVIGRADSSSVPTTPYNPPGFYLYWNIDLHTATAHAGTGTALYSIVAPPAIHRPPTPGGHNGYARLAIDCEYLTFPDLTPLQVFVGPGTTPSEPFGKLVGQMQVTDGSATLLTARPPEVKKGTTVTIVRDGVVVMTGRF